MRPSLFRILLALGGVAATTGCAMKTAAPTTQAWATATPDSAASLDALRSLAAKDRPAALAWIEKQHPRPRFALAAAVEGWIATDAGGAARYLGACRDDRWRGAVADALVLDALTERRPRTALALLARFPGSDQAELLRATAQAVLAELDPAPDTLREADFLRLLRPRAAEKTKAGGKHITLADFARLVCEKKALVLDARPETEHREARVPGALPWPAHDFEGAWLRHHAALEANRSRPIIVYCADGGCGASVAVARELRRLGYARAVAFTDGWAAWLDAGLPVETGPAHAPPPTVVSGRADRSPALRSRYR